MNIWKILWNLFNWLVVDSHSHSFWALGAFLGGPNVAIGNLFYQLMANSHSQSFWALGTFLAYTPTNTSLWLFTLVTQLTCTSLQLRSSSFQAKSHLVLLNPFDTHIQIISCNNRPHFEPWFNSLYWYWNCLCLWTSLMFSNVLDYWHCHLCNYQNSTGQCIEHGSPGMSLPWQLCAKRVSADCLQDIESSDQNGHVSHI